MFHLKRKKEWIHNEKLKFDSFEKMQKDNLNHYIEFLTKNNLENVFNCGLPVSKGKSILERGTDCSNEVISCIDSLSAMKKAKRLSKYYFQKVERIMLRCKN